MLDTEGRGPNLGNKLVERPRVTARLNQATERPLTIISARAGGGKSTSVAQWAAQSDRTGAWLCLNPAHSDPRTFLKSLVAALHRMAPEIEFDVDGVLGSHGAVDLEWAIAELVLVPLRELRRPSVLVLDDYHLVNGDDVHRALAWLLLHQPDALHLVISTRAMPPISGLTRLRSQGHVAVIDDEVLRFSIAETHTFYGRPGMGELSPTQIDALGQRTEGWIAGMQLCALALAGSEQPARFIESLTGDQRDLADYFLSEVLDRQSPARQRFLLVTSVLGRMCDDLCEAVVGVDPKISLRELDDDNLFVLPLDDRCHWYRYHHLFADLLLRRLQEDVDAPTVAEVHRLASEWFASQNLRDEAVAHAIAAGEFLWLAELIERWCPELFNAGDDARLAEWVAALPSDVFEARPGVRPVAAVCALLRGGQQRATALLEGIDAALDAAGLTPKHLARTKALSSFARSLLALQSGKPAAVAELSRVTMSLLPAAETVLRSAQLVILGMAQIATGDSADAEATSTSAAEISRDAGNHFGVLSSLGALAQIRRQQHRLQRAEQDCLTGIAYAEKNGCVLNSGTASLRVQLGLIALTRGDVSDAHSKIEEALQALRCAPFSPPLAAAYTALARVKAAQGDSEAAEVALDEAGLLVRMLRSPELLTEYELARAEVQQPSTDRAGVPQAVVLPLLAPLTPRERQVLALAARGLSNRQISDELQTALGTAKRHMHQVIGKLGASNRTEAVFIARELDLLKPA